MNRAKVKLWMYAQVDLWALHTGGFTMFVALWNVVYINSLWDNGFCISSC